jgi:Bacteroidetes VLRF1 release factor
VFDLPRELLVTLILLTGVQDAPATPEPSQREPPSKDSDIPAAATISCNLCQLTFPTVQEQREHVRSDLHRYNLKLKLRGNTAVSEVDFHKLIGELDESISGSDSSDSGDDDEEGAGPKNDTTLSALLKKQAKIVDEKGDDFVGKKKRGPGNAPLIWFKSSKLEDNVSLGVYRALFTDMEQQEEENMVEVLHKKQLSPVAHQAGKAPDMSLPHVFLCMIGGGHFAAMIVSLVPQLMKQGGERQAPVLAHKTFHRYTTRRKQGGSQSANDAAKGAAHSAGSSLRRYNEAALESEIRQLLGEWKSMIDTSSLLFVRATGSTNRRVLFGPYDGQVLRHNDPRMRSFPFSTRRATQSELMRSFSELSRLKISHIDESALASLTKPTDSSPRASKPSSRPQTPKISKEDEAAILHTSQIQALIRRSKAPALISYLKSNSLSPDYPFHPPTSQQNHHAPTPLHLAASTNSPAVVLALLTKATANAMILNGDGKPAFDLAGDRPTRDAFRVARHELGEGSWDWGAAHVPPPLSKTEADQRAEREKKEEEVAEAERRKAETERLKKEAVERAVNNAGARKGGGRLVGAEKSGAEKREEEGRGLSVEARARLERERRARAAEERIRRMQGG